MTNPYLEMWLTAARSLDAMARDPRVVEVQMAQARMMEAWMDGWLRELAKVGW